MDDILCQFYVNFMFLKKKYNVQKIYLNTLLDTMLMMLLDS